MKRLIFIIIFVILSPVIVFSQDMNLEKLSQSDRGKRLLEIATEAMKKYAPSYYKEDLVPIIAYEGTISDKKDKDCGRKAYRIDFPFDFTTANEGDNVYGGYVAIRGTGRVEYIHPTGWWGNFEIPEESEVQSGAHGSPTPIASPKQVPKNPFKDWQ